MLVDVRTDAEWRYVGVPDSAPARRPRRPGRVGRRTRRDARTRSSSSSSPTAGVAAGRPVVFLCRSGVRSIAAAQAATAAGLGPAYNVLEGFEGDVGPDGHRGHAGWRAAGLPWRQA